MKINLWSRNLFSPQENARIKIYIIRICKVTERFLFFHKFLDLKIGHIVYTCKTMRKLQSRVNYTRSIFRGDVKLWKGFSSTSTWCQNVILYCFEIREKLLLTRSCLFKADAVRYRLSPLLHNNLYVRKYSLKTGLKVEAFRFL